MSAFAVSNLIGNVLPELQIVSKAKPVQEGRSDFFNIELKLSNLVINGELSILDYVVRSKNRAEKVDNPSNFVRRYSQGDANDLRFDDLVYVVNTRLRPATTTFALTKDGTEVKETIKAIAKDLEDTNIL